MTSIPPLCKDDIVYTEEAHKASFMNNFSIEHTIIDERNAFLPPDSPPTENILNSIYILPHDVESILNSLQLGKASGQDEIGNCILKSLATPFSLPLSDRVKSSLASGKVPLIWKEANVSSIFKKEDPTVVSNFSKYPSLF